MPPDQSPNAIVIALDIGKSVSTLHKHEKETFFQSARNCVSWIIQRKIISQSADVLSLLLIGSDGSEGSHHPIKDSSYDNICGKFDFQVASWDMLKFIEEEIKTSKIESDWLGALIVSLEMLKAYEEFNSVNSKKIVVFSDFTKPALEDLSRVIKRIKTLNVEVTIIGPEHLQFSSESDEPESKRRKLYKNPKRQEGERVVFNLWKELPQNVCICTFESALKQLCCYTPKPKRPSYWNCVMDIGDVNINISVVKKTDPKPPKKFTTKYAKPKEGALAEEKGEGSQETGPTIKDTVMHYKHESGRDDEFVEVKPEDTVEGFRYGRTIIPFTEEDKTAMKYESGAKSFSVLGFTRASNVPYYLLSGECSYLVVPKHEDKNAEVALSALIQGLKKTNSVAIVRRVYSYNLGLSLGVLYPVVEELFCDDTNDITHKESLLFLELAFEDDVKSVDFPSLEKVAKGITQQQFDAVDDLIDGMNLMKADRGLRGEECEAFDLSSLHDYKEQFFHYCVIQRGLYPDKPLSSSLPPYIENFIKVPKPVEEKCKSAFHGVRTQFRQRKEDAQNLHTAQKKPTGSGDQDKFEHFSESTVDAEENPIKRTWMRLFRRGFPTDEELSKVFNEYAGAAESELSLATINFGLVMAQVRTIYLKTDPAEYNNWMVGFKNHLLGKDGLESRIWEVIVTEKMGLIGKEENQLSNLSNKEAAEFLSLAVNWPSTHLLDELIAEQMNVNFES